MKRFIILFLLVSLQYSYAQWEGAGWKRDPNIAAMAVCNGTIIRAQYNYIMTSSDLGSTWQKASEFKENIYTFAQNENSMIVAAAYYGGVYLSSDCGLSWESISNGVISGEGISRIQISGDTIVAGSSGGTYTFTSTDLGESWELKSNGLPITDELSIYSIAFKNETIFASLVAKYDPGTANQGLYKSSDFGDTWEYLGAEIAKVGIVYIYGDRVYVYSKGLKISEDMGETWTPVTLGESVLNFNSNADKLFTGTANGVFCSLDGGNTWIDYGLKGVSVKSIGFIGDKVVASSTRTQYILESPGEDWQVLDSLIDYGTAEKFAVKDGSIYAYTEETQILMSDDIGETWEYVNLKTWIQKANAFEAINEKLYLATTSKDMKSGGLQVSSDNGKSWQPDLNLAPFVEKIDGIPGMNLPIISLAKHGSYIFMGTDVGLLHSTDNGENWDIYDNNIDLTIRGFASIGSELFIKTYPLQSTTDYGETWIEKEGNGLPTGRASSLFAYENTLVSSFKGKGLFEGSGVYISKDRGDNWDYIVKKNHFSYNGKGTRDVDMVYAFDNYIFASSNIIKANFVTADEGENWVAINEGLPDNKINDIKRVGDYLIVGTSGGFSRAKISDIADMIITAVAEVLPAAQENTVYPNPTDASLYIDKYEGSPLGYEIFDYSGKNVLSGTLRSHEIDVSALPAAAYIIVLDDKTDTHTMKFIKK